MGTVDRTRPEGRWEFDAEVAEAFDDMLARSIPWYENMRAIVTDVAASFVPKGTPEAGSVVDLGASRGEGLAPLIDRLGINATYQAIEVSPPMLAALRERFPKGSAPAVTVRDFDLRRGYPPIRPADATLLVLTLQFVPIEHRQRVLRNVWKHTVPGGALVLVEKVLGATAEIDALLVERYYALKGENGYSSDEIERKRLALEGVLVPVTARWNEDLLRQAGFADVDCFWRWANFAGWVAVR
jgi:tRNA (cmo5U34)-methyltransferase